MTFKNDLSNLRSQIKSLNQKTNQYTTKCNDFQVELDHLFHMNEALQYKNRELVPMAATKRLDLNAKQKQMKETCSHLEDLMKIKGLLIMNSLEG